MPSVTREWLPAGTPKGVFLLLHGIESHAGWFAHFAPLLTENGYAAVAVDRPGSGAAPGPRGHLDSYRSLLEDVSALATKAGREYGPVHLAGMSWGGMAALYLALRRPWLFASLTLLAPGLATSRDIGLFGKARAAAAFFSGAAPLAPLAVPFTPADFTTDRDWQNFISADPARNAVLTTGFAIETTKMRRFIGETAGRRRLPSALCLLAEADRIVDNPATGKLAVRAGARLEVVPGSAHTLIFENPEFVAGRMARHATAATAAAAAPAGNVWLLGGGSVGGALAALLARGGRGVSVLVKEKYLGRYRAAGITLRSGRGEMTARGITFAAAPEELVPEPELVVVAVKSFDTAAILRLAVPSVPAGAVVACVQNGVTNEEEIHQALPGNTIVAASVLAGLEMLSPGLVSYPDDRGGLAAACWRGDEVLAKAVWQKYMPATGMAAPWLSGRDAAARLKWSKLILNLGTNAINSVTGLTAAEILSHPELGRLAVDAMREGLRVMSRLGLTPVNLPGYPVELLGRLLRVCPARIARRAMAWRAGGGAEAAFSMRQDFERNRPATELAALNGHVVEAAGLLGVGAEANRRLVGMAEAHGRGKAPGTTA